MSKHILQTFEIVAFIPALLSVVICVDFFRPPVLHDTVVVVDKRSPMSGSSSYYLKAKGKYDYHESVPKPLFDSVTVGDTLFVILTPTFVEWRAVGIVQNENIRFLGHGEDINALFWFAGVFLTPLLVFFYSSNWKNLNRIVFWTTYSALVIGSLVVWVCVGLKWSGLIQRF
jgi:hypothetical protein